MDRWWLVDLTVITIIVVVGIMDFTTKFMVKDDDAHNCSEMTIQPL